MTEANTLTDAQRLAIRAKLAEQMGIPENRWTFRCIVQRHNVDSDGFSSFCYRCGDLVSKFGRVPPDPFTSAADNRALVEWIAADNVWWSSFTLALFDEMDAQKFRFQDNYSSRRMMTAPLPIIALAAAAALGITAQEEGK